MIPVIQTWQSQARDMIVDEKPIRELRELLVCPMAATQASSRRPNLVLIVTPLPTPLLFHDASFFRLGLRP
jgi:hypothetical protein